MLLETPKAQTGWIAKPFTLLDPDGELYSLADVEGKKGLLVAFICNHCPYVKAIANRLAEDAKALQAMGIGVVAINSNDAEAYPEDSPAMMKAFADEYNFSFPYLVDENQLVGHAYGAVCTPDFFGFNATGELQYRGRLDDAKMDDASNRKTELLDAMRQIAQTGIAPSEQFPSMGCSIKWRS